MPIYEYTCRRCGAEFEVLIRGQETPQCPTCQSADLQKALSSFAVGGSGASVTSAPSPCGRCGDPRGPGACSMN